MKGFARIVTAEEFTNELSVLSGSKIPEAKSTSEREAVLTSAKDSAFTQTVTAKADVFETSPKAVLEALKVSLSLCGVNYIRVMACDTAAYIRTKAVKLSTTDAETLANGVGMVQCMMGLHCDYDLVVEESGLGVAGMFNLVPDFHSFRILPYAKGHAATYGYLCAQGDSREISPLCPRGFLRRMSKAAAELQLNVQVGAELEFVLRNADGSLVDNTTWASARAIDESSEILEEIDACLSQQGVQVLQVHAESCPGQFEVVLQHSDNLIAMADAILTAKQSIAAVARRHGKRASFVPKVEEMQAGSGMHLHLSTAHQQEEFMAGVLYHIPALTAILAPTTNSFR